jgi:hypothetical protein
MTIHDVDIYHCQKCGRICSCEHEERVPECCGEKMARAVAHITYEDDREEIPSVEKVVEKSHHNLESAKRK